MILLRIGQNMRVPLNALAITTGASSCIVGKPYLKGLGKSSPSPVRAEMQGFSSARGVHTLATVILVAAASTQGQCM